MSTEETRVVQTELPEKEYERLREVADQQGKPLKRVLREAAQEYGNRHLEYDEDDPFFAAEPIDAGVETDATNVDELLAESLKSEIDDA